MKHFLIVAGGEIEDAFVCRIIQEEHPTSVIAVDCGMDFFYRNKKMPDVIVGDFDSAEPESLTYFRRQGVRIKELSPMKDDTDTEAALRLALQMGAERITLLGAIGSRIDHMLANIELLGIGLMAGVPMVMMDAKNKIRMADTGLTIKKCEQHGTYVSLLPYTPEVTHLTLRGFKYPLNDVILRGFCSLGISNEIIEEEAEILFGSGILLVMETKD